MPTSLSRLRLLIRDSVEGDKSSSCYKCNEDLVKSLTPLFASINSPVIYESKYDLVNTKGTIPFGAFEIDIQNIGDNPGTIMESLVPPKTSIKWGAGSTLPFEYDATGTAFLISYLLPRKRGLILANDELGGVLASTAENPLYPLYWID